jgi:hypothetical protein
MVSGTGKEENGFEKEKNRGRINGKVCTVRT